MSDRPKLDIDITVRDLIRTIPRLGFTLMKMRVEEDKSDTPYAAYITKDLLVRYSKNKMETYTLAERIAVMQHEAMHVIHKHWDRLVGVSQQMVRETAEEMAINQHINNMPRDSIFPETYDLPRGKSLEEYYTLLLPKAKENPSNFKAIFDKNPLKGDTGEMGKIDVHRAENICKDAEQYEKSVGKDPGDMFLKIVRVPTNYQAKIRRVVACQNSTTRIKRTRSRRSRRYRLSPGKKFELELGKAIFGLDTSMSMNEKELGQSIDCGNKISHLVSELVWIQCDTKVQDVKKEKKKKSKNINEIDVHGRGGTDLTPIFEEAIKHGYPKVPLVIFTDGELWNWPTLEEMQNSVWIITNEKAGLDFHSKFPTIDYAVLL
jgi:predicted metal-dependent peptidase